MSVVKADVILLYYTDWSTIRVLNLFCKVFGLHIWQ